MVPNTQSYDKLIEKWAPVLDEESAGKITDNHKKAVTAAVLENQEIALREEGMIQEATNTTTTNTATTNWNPVLIALVRRAMPNLMAYDICGVQPMSGPTGLIFAMKSRYAAEILHQEKHCSTKLKLSFQATAQEHTIPIMLQA